MPQVPYTPVPSATPSTSATPTQHLDKKQAFGQNIGESLNRLADGMSKMAQGADALARGTDKMAAGMGEKAAGLEKIAKGKEKEASGQAAFGRALEGAGTEIFGRAVALQNMINDTDARKASTEYMDRVSTLHAEYHTLQGKAAVDNLPKFKEELMKARDEIRGTLKNPMAQKLYDAESQGTMSRTMFSGASHAATGAKNYAISTLESRSKLLMSAPYANPNDPVEYSARQNELIESTFQLGSLKAGISDPDHPMMKAGVLAATSEQRMNWLIQKAQLEPQAAANMLKDVRKEMTIQDHDKVEKVITERSRAIGAANIGREAWLEGQETADKPAQSLEQMQENARKKVEVLGSKDPLFVKAAVDSVWANYNQGRRGQLDINRTNLYTVDQAIGAGVKDVRELRNMGPKIEAAINALPPDIQNNLQGRINAVNAKQDKKTEEETDKRILGIMRTNKEKFLDLDLTKEKLSHSDYMKYADFQYKMKQSPRDDPRVMRAAGIIRSAKGNELRELHVDRWTERYSDEYYAYLGTLSAAIDQHMEDNGGKKPTAEELVDKIAPQVIRSRYEPKWFGITTEKTPFFQQPESKHQAAYDDWATSLKEMAKAENKGEPSDAELKNLWTRKQVKELYGKKKETAK